MKSIAFWMILTGAFACHAAETVVSEADQVALGVTIYNENRALVRDERRVSFVKGLNELAFAGVSAELMPQTALLKGVGISVREQNFNFDLLTHTKMMEKSVGNKVSLVWVDPATGKISREEGRLLAYNEGLPVLEINGKIETTYPGRIVFDKVPADLRSKPTLTMNVVSDETLSENVRLDYLTTGLSWKADYVARLTPDETKMDLNGFVTLTNRSGTAYRQAMIQLVAGDVNLVHEQLLQSQPRMMKMSREAVIVADNGMAAEALSDFYLYTIPHKTDLLSNQTKQVALLSGQDISVKKTYELNRPFSVYETQVSQMKPEIYVQFDNSLANKLGKPLPKGTVRLYKEDSKGNVQFVGEDRISHTAENEMVRLHIGRSFNLSAEMHRTAFKKLSEKLKRGTYEVTFKNGGEESATVQLTLDFPNDFKLLEESVPSERRGSNTLRWQLDVPAKEKATLTYRIEFE